MEKKKNCRQFGLCVCHKVCGQQILKQPMPHMPTLQATNAAALCESVTASWHMDQHRERGEKKSLKKIGGKRKRNKEREQPPYQTAALSSRRVGEITACLGCITEMTVKMIKNVRNPWKNSELRLCFYQQQECTGGQILVQERKVLVIPLIFNEPVYKCNLVAGATATRSNTV